MMRAKCGLPGSAFRAYHQVNFGEPIGRPSSPAAMHRHRVTACALRVATQLTSIQEINMDVSMYLRLAETFVCDLDRHKIEALARLQAKA